MSPVPTVVARFTPVPLPVFAVWFLEAVLLFVEEELLLLPVLLFPVLPLLSLLLPALLPVPLFPVLPLPPLLPPEPLPES